MVNTLHCTHLHAGKVMLKVLHSRLQEYVNQELPDFQSGLRKRRGTRNQIANILSITKNAREFQTDTYLCFIDYAKAFDCVDHNKLFSSAQFISVTQPYMTLCDPMDCSTSGLPVHHHSQSLLKLMSIESVMPSTHLILCHPLLLLPSIFPSTRAFSNESVLPIWWPKYWSFSFNISPSIEHPGLISFRMDWLDLPAGQRTLMSLLQHYSLKASILQQ